MSSFLAIEFTVSEIDMLLGAYGWMHDSWDESFYPEDLPYEWQLTYYSNEFNAVLVPAKIWSEDFGSKSESPFFCEEWLDNVSDEFHFYIECHADMFATISLQVFTENLQTLQPQLAGLVILGDELPASSKKVFIDLAAELETAVFINDGGRKDRQAMYFRNSRNGRSNFMLLESNLLDLRAVRKEVDDFVAQSESSSDLPAESESTTIIVNHLALSVDDLIKFRSVLEIMGL